MSNIINDAVRKLSDIIEKAPLKWDEFEAALNGLKDINFYDDQYDPARLG